MLEVTWSEATSARNYINSWYERFPDQDGRFGRMLLSEDNEQHYGAMDELFIHHLLDRVVEEVRYEEGGRGPDFRIYRREDLVLAVEVVSLFMKDEWSKEWRDFGRMADEINSRTRVNGFMVRMEPESLPRTPPVKELSSFIENWIETLQPPSRVASDYARTKELPRTKFRDGDIRIELRALPLRDDAASNTDPDAPLVAMGPVIGGMVDSHARLRRVLSSKRPARYGLSNVSYVIAVGNHDMFCSLDQVQQALYGPDHVVLDEDRRNDVTWAAYAKDAFFGFDLTSGKGRNTRVSGVALFSWQPWTPENASFLLFDNPWAQQPAGEVGLSSKHRFRELENGWDWDPPLPE
jgi:hypothetical protein